MNTKIVEKFKSNVSNDFKKILKEIRKHRTVDTYAKKLFLQDSEDSLDTLYNLKLFLCLYFAFEQSKDENKITFFNNKDADLNGLDIQEKMFKLFSNPIDYRYDVFFATLLNKSFELPQNLNIISWNYDYQLELAYKEFAIKYSYEMVNEKLGLYPYVYKAKKVKPKIVKLNGTAGLFKKKDNHTEEEFNSFLQGQGPLPIHDFIDPFDSVLDNAIDYRDTALSFAWEDKLIQKTAIENAIEMIRKTDLLVVIGYSFPYFNRTIDRKILTNLPHGSKLIVQCLEKDYIGIEANLNNILYNDGRPRNVKPEFYDDLSQFFIPNVLI